MDGVMRFKDNVHPPLLINLGTDFSSFEPESPCQTPDKTGEDDLSPVDIRATAGIHSSTAKTSIHKLSLKKKRKHFEAIPDLKFIDILLEKWEKDQEKSDVDFALKKQFIEETKCEKDEFLTCFKGIAELIAKLAKKD